MRRWWRNRKRRPSRRNRRHTRRQVINICHAGQPTPSGRVVVALVAALSSAAAQETTTPVWSTPDRFWFRVPVPDGNEWWTVDARHGARERLFDHRRLAIELSEQSKRTYTPLTLPFADPASGFIVKYDGSNAALQEGALAIEFSLDDERWRCELQGEWDWGRTPPSDYYCAALEGAAAPASGAGPVRSPTASGRRSSRTTTSLSARRAAQCGCCRLTERRLRRITWDRFDGRAIRARLRGYRVHSDAWRSAPSAGSVKNLDQHAGVGGRTGIGRWLPFRIQRYRLTTASGNAAASLAAPASSSTPKAVASASAVAPSRAITPTTRGLVSARPVLGSTTCE